MRFHLRQLVRAPLVHVEAALLDPAFIAHLATLPDLGQPALLDQSEAGDIVQRRIRYAFVGELSAAVTAVVDPRRLTWVEESAFARSTHRSTFRIVPDHYANLLEAAGAITLRPEDGLVAREAEGDLRVRLPLVGRKVETAIVQGMAAHAEREADALQRWIDAGR